MTLLLLATLAQAGDVYATTDDGRFITVHEDGTWERYEPVPAAPGEASCDWVNDHSQAATGDARRVTPLGGALDRKQRDLDMVLQSGPRGVAWLTEATDGKTCMADDATMTVFFTDGTTLDLTNDLRFNCDGDFMVYLAGNFGKTKQLAVLEQKLVETVRIGSRHSVVQQSLKPAQAEQLQAAFQCL